MQRGEGESRLLAYPASQCDWVERGSHDLFVNTISKTVCKVVFLRDLEHQNRVAADWVCQDACTQLTRELVCTVTNAIKDDQLLWEVS